MSRRLDAHCHVWDVEVRDQPWITGEAMAPIRRSFGADELAAEAAGCGVSGIVVVQTVADIAETEELLDLAGALSMIVGVVGYVDVAAPDVGDQLDRLLERPTGSWLVGVRALVQNEPDPQWLTHPAVIAGLREIARRELTFDLLIRPDQLDAALSAVSMVAEGRFVVDHLAKPAIAAGAWEPWATGFAALARPANVWAKLSGMVTEAIWTTWSKSDLEPYVAHALSTFGAGRLLFGSDWPVCTLAAPYRRVVAVVDELIGQLSMDERAGVLGGTASIAYPRVRQ